MSDPPYPHPSPAPGSNAIGVGAIGVMQIGDISTFDVYATLMSQYANDPVMLGMITAFNAAMDMTLPMSNFYDKEWNIFTAIGYGLDVWGRIVGVVRTISIPGSVQFFGFEEAGASWTGFGQGGFASPGSGLTQNYILSDSDFRRYILAQAAANISNGAIPTVNQILLSLFPGRGKCFVADGRNMSLTYTFNFALTASEIAIVSLLAVSMSATGVVINIAHL
jgi:hypothetical protein